MKLDSLSLNLRAGNAWEALDLGAAMQRQWMQPLIRVWLAVYAPVVLLVALVLWLTSERYIIFGTTFLWWLKPLFERFLLHVLSRSAFGETPSVRATLGAWREILTPGLFRQLTYARLSPYRSFYSPVMQLERQTGGAASERRRVLGRRASGTAGWNTIVCAHFEAILLFSLAMLVHMFMPDNEYSIDDTTPHDEASWWVLGWSDYVFSALAATAIAPLYVASGFALYLHRRTLLEGWDIELGLRRIQSRLTERLRGTPSQGLMVLLGVALGAAVVFQSPQALAQSGTGSPAEPATAAERTPKSVVNEVLAAPEFGAYREEQSWVRKRKDAPKPRDLDLDALKAWSEFLAMIGAVLRALVWIALAAIIIAVLWQARKLLAGWQPTVNEPYRPPDQLFGLDVRPESLPPDIGAAARTLIDAGRIRDGLSLLYRGALSTLVNRFAVELESGSTEGDALAAARGTLATSAGDYFAQLVDTWRAAAYANRLPPSEGAKALAQSWSIHFNAQSRAPAA